MKKTKTEGAKAPSFDFKKLAADILRYRLSNDIGLVAFAKKAKVSTTALWRLEACKGAGIRFNEMLKVVHAIGSFTTEYITFK